MNGEVNGLEEAMDVSSSAKAIEGAEPALTNNHCDENSITQHSNTSENSNNLDHAEDENSGGPADTSYPGFTGFSGNEDSRTDVDSAKQQQNEDASATATSNALPANNQCSNSNESITNSIDGINSVDSIHVENQKGDSDSGGDEESEDEEDSEDDSTDEDGTVGSEEPRAEDTVSINSDSDGGDESTTGSQTNTKNNDIIILDNLDRNGDNANGAQSPEIHEIASDDDCVLTDDKSNSNTTESVQQARRSGRSLKRMNYTDDALENGEEESDIEEVSTEDPLDQAVNKNIPIVVNDTKALVEMASKQMKNQGSQKKEPTVVIIDTNSIISGKSPLSLSQNRPNIPSTSVSAQSLYQSIAARGTTVTPVHTRHSTAAVQTTHQPIILPSLTDDMYVVEAPSFIVPYVYEKPSLRPFREYVDVLGRELEKERLKEEAIRIEKEREEKEKRDRERKERGEESEKEESEKEETEKEAEKPIPVEPTEEPVKNKSLDKKNRKKGRHDEDDASWDGDSSMDSEEEVISEDDQGTTVVIKEKEDDSLETIKTNIVTDLTESPDSKPPGVKTEGYFDNALGMFFTNIGVSLVQEFVQNDLLKQQKRKLHKELKTGGTNTKPTESAIISLSKNLEFSKENNAPYCFQQKKCKFCSFKTESMLVMAHHLETPHMKNNVYNCNFCPFEIKSPHDILYHMEEEHNTRGRLERAPSYHQCANCPFEDNGKGKLARHLIPCAKKFKPEQNLAPPVEWEPPAKIPKITRARNSMMSSYQAAFNRAQVGANMSARQPVSLASLMPGVAGGFRGRGRSPMGVSPRGAPPHGAPLVRGNMMVRHNSPAHLMANYPIMQGAQGGSKTTSPKMLHQPSISITPLPRAPQPAPTQPPQAKGTFVICEICDGYIKDLEQLRNHMQWIHKVKIHPKMIYNRPPLNCQKCQFRFFTDQGLERHLLGSHGLVTSSMQEAANKGKDSGRCPVCGRVYQWKLLNHVARDHNLTLKPAHLSYKCTVCTATFGMYKQFENHVYSAHSVVAKRVMDKTKSAAPAAKPAPSEQSMMKPLKINDEITITPQPSRAPPQPTAKGKRD